MTKLFYSLRFNIMVILWVKTGITDRNKVSIIYRLATTSP